MSFPRIGGSAGLRDIAPLKGAVRRADINHNVRATRAYLAGLGTAGSMVVGAALLFVLASALVAFHGWPRADGAGGPARVVLSAPAGSATRVARRLAFLAPAHPSAIARSRVATHPRAASAGPNGRRAVQIVQGSGSHTGPSTIGRTGTTPRSGTPTTGPTQPPRRTTHGPPASTPKPPTTTTPSAPTAGGTVTTVVKKVAGTVSGTGSGVGDTVKKVTGTVGGTISNPPVPGGGAGSTVTPVTGTVGGTVSGTGSGAGDTVKKVTGTVGSVLGG
jgi:hypothetical protein